MLTRLGVEVEVDGCRSVLERVGLRLTQRTKAEEATVVRLHQAREGLDGLGQISVDLENVRTIERRIQLT
ncbi:MAG: hypothetical protein ACYCQJ_13100 [Nitrososphaerales archaeon]